MIRLVYAGSDGTVGGPGGTPISSRVLVYTANVPTIQVLSIAQPPAGTEWSYVVPTNSAVRLASGFTVFSASSVVANRYLGMVLKDPQGTVIARYYQQGNALTASLTQHLTYARTDKWIQAGNSVPGTTESQIGMPPLVIPAGYTLGSATGNMDVADRYSTILLWFQTWTSPPIPDVPGPSL